MEALLCCTKSKEYKNEALLGKLGEQNALVSGGEIPKSINPEPVSPNK